MDENNQSEQNLPGGPNNRRNKLIGILCIAVFVAILAVIFVFVGEPMIKFVNEPEQFRDWIDALGIWGRLIFIGMMALQIIVAVIPGEPLEIVAGYAFGVLEGTLLCMLGALVGGVIVFLFVRYFGAKVVDIFIPHEKITQLKFLNTKKKLTLLTTVVFLIPGTPKDVLTYFVGLTPMKLTTWMLITSLARFPSIITSTMGGNALGTKEYIAAVIIFAVTIILSAAGLLIYKKRLARKHSAGSEGGLKASDAQNDAADSPLFNAEANSAPDNSLINSKEQQDADGGREAVNQSSRPEQDGILSSPRPGKERPNTNLTVHK